MATCVEVKPKEKAYGNYENKLENDDDVFPNLKKCNKDALKFINEGLNQEDKGNIQNAISCYEKGLRIIESGIKSKESNGLNACDSSRYKDLLSKILRAQKETMIRLETLKAENPSILHDVIVPSAPPLAEKEFFLDKNKIDTTTKQDENQVWQDVKQLLSIKEGIRLFHVDEEGNVSAWSSVQKTALEVFQLFKDNIKEKAPSAFIKCGEWVYPLEPGESPVLKTQKRTYMFPEINMETQDMDLSKISSIGVFLEDLVPDRLVKRFERILSCYGNFRVSKEKEENSPNDKIKPQRPPPPVFKNGESINQNGELAIEGQGAVETMGRNSGEVVTTQGSWTEKVTAGINVGSQWISWGLLKGAEYTSALVEMGAQRLRERIKPNEEAKVVDPEITHNIRQLHQATGSVVQVSSFLVSALGTLTISLGKKIAPHVSEQGQKLLPAKYRADSNPNTQKKIEDAKKVAAAGLQGLSLMFLTLEQAGKNLYHTVTDATVQTLHFKYGEEVADVTHDAMGAAGNTLKTFWNVSQLGPKAIAKRTLKDTGKAMVLDQEEDKVVEVAQDETTNGMIQMNTVDGVVQLKSLT